MTFLKRFISLSARWRCFHKKSSFFCSGRISFIKNSRSNPKRAVLHYIFLFWWKNSGLKFSYIYTVSKKTPPTIFVTLFTLTMHRLAPWMDKSASELINNLTINCSIPPIAYQFSEVWTMLFPIASTDGKYPFIHWFPPCELVLIK
jgi:hypothetical protein